MLSSFVIIGAGIFILEVGNFQEAFASIFTESGSITKPKALVTLIAGIGGLLVGAYELINVILLMLRMRNNE